MCAVQMTLSDGSVKRMRWVWAVPSIEHMKNAYKVLIGKTKEKTLRGRCGVPCLLDHHLQRHDMKS